MRMSMAALGALAVLLMGCKSDQHVAITKTPAPTASERDGYSVAMAVPPPAHAPAPPAVLKASIDRLNQQFGGKAGIAVHSVTDGWTISSRGDLHLPQQSVSKLWVALTLLDLRDQGKISLDQPITITTADLTLFHQPVASLLKDGSYTTSVGDLEHRALTTSDNTANDRLLTLVGGPNAVKAMFQRKNIDGVRFGLGEREKQSITAGLTWQQSYSLGRNFEAARAKVPMDQRLAAFNAYADNPMDGAEPVAIADALSRLVQGQLLSPSSTQWLLETLSESRTGRARLRAVLPDDWTIMHKTGTGQDLGRRTAGFNDVGILKAPDGRTYTVAVMIGDTSRPVHERQQLIQDVAQAVVTQYRNHPAMAVAQQDAGMTSKVSAN